MPRPDAELQEGAAGAHRLVAVLAPGQRLPPPVALGAEGGAVPMEAGDVFEHLRDGSEHGGLMARPRRGRKWSLARGYTGDSFSSGLIAPRSTFTRNALPSHVSRSTAKFTGRRGVSLDQRTAHACLSQAPWPRSSP